METYFTGGHSIVATFADTTAGEAGLYVASRESGDILKVGNGSGDATEEFEVRTPQAVAQEDAQVVSTCITAWTAATTTPGSLATRGARVTVGGARSGVRTGQP